MANYKQLENAYKEKFSTRGNGPAETCCGLYRELPDKTMTGFRNKDLYNLSARYLDHEAIRYLTAENCKPQEDDNGNTALHALTQTPYRLDPTNFITMEEPIRQTAVALLDAGVDPWHKNEESESAAMLAAAAFMYPMLQALAGKGISLDILNNRKENLLHTIIRNLRERNNIPEERENAIRSVKALLQAGNADFSGKDSSGNDALYYSREYGLDEVTELLIPHLDPPVEEEEDVEQAIVNLGKSLEKASPEDFLALVREFPYKKTVFPTYDHSYVGKTLLHLAASRAYPEAISYLLGEGLDPNAADPNGITPIMELAWNCSDAENTWRSAMLLLDAGADPLLKSQHGSQAFQMAARYYNTPFLKAYRDKDIPLTGISDDGCNAIHFALDNLKSEYNFYISGHKKMAFNPSDVSFEKYNSQVDKPFDTIKLLMEAGVDPEEKSNDGESPVDFAFRYEARKLRALMKGIISENNPDDPQQQKLAETGGMNFQEAVYQHDRVAIAAIADCRLADINSIEPLLRPSDSRYDPDWLPPYGDGTPLAQACLLFYPPIISQLLDLGADPNAKDNDGRTAVSWLFFRQRELQIRHFTENTPAAVIHKFVEAGLDIDATVNNSGDTILSLACNSYFGDIYPINTREGAVLTGYDNYVVKETFRTLFLKALLEHNPDVNLGNNKARTPLMSVCYGNYGYFPLADEIQKILLQKGASVSVQDNFGNTPLIFAAANENLAQSYIMAEQLFNYGDPMPLASNIDGKTAMDYAVQLENEKLVKLLLEKTGTQS